MTILIKKSLTALACALILAAPVHAEAPKQIDVPAGDLVAALESLAKQAQVNLVYQAGQMQGLTTHGVSGTLTPRQAVVKLLEGTSLRLSTDEATGAMMILAGTAPTKISAAGVMAETAALRLARSENSDDENSQTSADSQSPVSSETEDNKLQEIVVTAQKREERLRDVPISISVLSGDDLDRSSAKGVGEELNRVPGVVFDASNGTSSTAGGAQLAIRGVTAPSSYVSGPSPVGYYLDSVPFGLVRSSTIPDSGGYDLERVEVLRGPQGTLYGASAQAGVVRILTKDANLNKFELKSRGLVSNTEYGGINSQADLAVNVPLIEGKLAARAVIGYQDLAGWIDKSTRHDVNDTRRSNARIKINAQPTDRLSVALTGWMSRSDTGAQSIATDGVGRFSSVADTEALAADFNLYGFKAGYDFPLFSITSSTSYLDYINDNSYSQNPAGTRSYARTALSARNFTQELNFASRLDGPWRWTAGVMYRDGHDRQFQDIYFNIYPTHTEYSSESMAVFGELTRTFLDGRLELTAGLRRFEDTVGQQHRGTSSNTPPPAGLAADVEDKFSATTPRVILNWHPREDTTVYASYAEGFRSGLHQNPVVRVALPSIPTARPDLLKNYEIGAKGGLLEDRLGYDVAMYYMDWQDVQLPLGVIINDIGRVLLTNGASASGFGTDAALTVRPARGLEFGLNVSWNNLELDEDVFDRNVLVFPQGDRLNGSIETTLGLSASYSFPLGGNGLEGTLTASANRRSRLSSSSLSGTTVRVDQGEPILIGRAGFTIDSSAHWSATLFIDNINNEQDLVAVGGALQAGVTNYFYSRPRTVGLQFEYRL